MARGRVEPLPAAPAAELISPATESAGAELEEE